MALKLLDGEVDGIAVVRLEGRIVLGEDTSALREKVKALIASGKKSVVLNMNDVTMIDSSGLGALVTAYSAAKSGGAVLRLSNLGSKFQGLLQITKLVTVFEVSGTEAEAVAACRSSAS